MFKIFDILNYIQYSHISHMKEHTNHPINQGKCFFTWKIYQSDNNHGNGTFSKINAF